MKTLHVIGRSKFLICLLQLGHPHCFSTMKSGTEENSGLEHDSLLSWLLSWEVFLCGMCSDVHRKAGHLTVCGASHIQCMHTHTRTHTCLQYLQIRREKAWEIWSRAVPSGSQNVDTWGAVPGEEFNACLVMSVQRLDVCYTGWTSVHMTRSPRPSPAVFAYCKRLQTGGGRWE